MVDGLSVLIPCYRYDPAPLVKSLLPQLEGVTGMEWEIIIGNDFSGLLWQDTFDSLPRLHSNLTVLEAEKNLGRAAIRNRMASMARYGHLLFIDADSLPVSARYIQGFREAAGKADVLVGGTAYQAFPGCADSLRYRYGIEREATSAAVRNRHPFHRIALNNVLARKDVWTQIPLNEAIIGYGHEDTYWGLALEWAGKSVLHLDNPVYHIGLEYNETFLAKCKDSASNLAQLVNIGLIPPEAATLSRVGEKLFRNKGRRLFMLGLRLARPRLSYLAVQAGPNSLRALDLLKLEAYVSARLKASTTGEQT